MSLLVRLIFLVALAVLPAIGIQIYNEIAMRGAREAEAREQSLRLARQTAAELERTVEGIRELMVTLAALPVVHGKDGDACTAFFSDLRRHYADYLVIGAVDEKGIAFCNSTRPDRRPDVSDREYFRRVMATGAFAVGNFTHSRVTDRKLVTFAYPVRDGNGRLTGAVIASVDLDWLGAHISRKSFPADTALAIADRDGTILVRYPDSESWIGRKVPPRLERLMKPAQESVHDETDLDGVRRIGATVPVSFGSGGTDFVVAVGFSKAAVFAGINQATRHGVVLIAVAGLLALLAALAGGRLFIRQPVERLLDATRRWQRGDYTARAGLRDRGSEIGRLGEAFDAMAAAVAERDAALRAAAETLEQRVAQRTQELRDANEELRRSRARYTALFEQSPVLLYLMRRRPSDGAFVFEEINPTCIEATGFPAEAFIGRSPREFFPEPAGSLMDAKYRECAETGRRIEYEVTGELPVGRVVRRTFLVPLFGADGEVAKIFGTSLDITEMRRIEDELRHSQKMEAVGQLTGGVAHDFNNLLSAVLGNLELMRKDALSEKAAQHVASAIRAAERGAKLTQQLLAFSRKQHLQLQPVDVNALLARMQDMLASTMGAIIRISVAPVEDAWPALVDANQLELAILNLAINARDAMPVGGTLVILTRNIAANDAGAAASWPADLERGDYVCISLVDSGTGIPPDVLARVFEPFYTTKEVGKGSGLGLSQVYGFAKQAGGTVRIESEPGKGTSVHLYLPRAVGAAAPARADSGGRAAPAAVAAANATNGRVLVVDDDNDVRELLTTALHGLGYDVAEAKSGFEALERLERERAPFDLLLADFAMPGMTGAALVSEALRRYPGLAVLLVTGYADLSDRAGEAMDGVPTVAKPFKLAELDAKVREALAVSRRRHGGGGSVVPFRPPHRG